jgi:hypothetical protein
MCSWFTLLAAKQQRAVIFCHSNEYVPFSKISLSFALSNYFTLEMGYLNFMVIFVCLFSCTFSSVAAWGTLIRRLQILGDKHRCIFLDLIHNPSA